MRKCAEAKAILVGLQLADWVGCTDVVVENDNESVIHAIKEGEAGNHSFQLLLEDIHFVQEPIYGAECFTYGLLARHRCLLESSSQLRVTFLNLSDVPLQCDDLAQLLGNCLNLRRLWVLDTVGDKGLEAVGSSCPLLEELRVFPANPFDADVVYGVTESGLVSVSYGCPKLHYVLYFCRQMTDAVVATFAKNCPNFTHFRLCIMNPGEPDDLTDESVDEAFGSVVKSCKKLRRLVLSGLLTDLTFEYIGKYAKNLETLSVAFVGSSDLAMQCVLAGCPKLRRLEIRDCPFGNNALLSGLEKYESMRSLWMSTCNVTMNACRLLAKEMPRLRS
uniref:RNase H type-1 domain-containing protein n=1 Tax=Chenopodium quinoa TaxID=63459 RepID=A0A803MSZ5_CHEQI